MAFSTVRHVLDNNIIVIKSEDLIAILDQPGLFRTSKHKSSMDYVVLLHKGERDEMLQLAQNLKQSDLILGRIRAEINEKSSGTCPKNTSDDECIGEAKPAYVLRTRKQLPSSSQAQHFSDSDSLQSLDDILEQIPSTASSNDYSSSESSTEYAPNSRKKEKVTQNAKIVRRTWNTPERHALRKSFAKNLAEGGPLPSLAECKDVKIAYPTVLASRSLAQIKAWVNNDIRRTKK